MWQFEVWNERHEEWRRIGTPIMARTRKAASAILKACHFAVWAATDRRRVVEVS